MGNRLAASSSPYLLQHANNPVDWYPWGTEALQKAKNEDKPIFLSIGYAACHWCHVMAHESFENPSTAEIMNTHFVNIKVDREERPDLDSIYMNAVVAMTGHGGWPMSVFLTPDGEPFYGGTYFPPTPRYGMPSFPDLLLGIIRAWREDRSRILKSGEELTSHLNKIYENPKSGSGYDHIDLDEATKNLAESYDWTNGGWGKPPKFPQPMSIEYLLRRSIRGDKAALDMAVHALRKMAKGGMYDVIGGGFSRYSTDEKWLIPHFEKMLYDNALLSLAYLHAYLITGDKEFRSITEQTLDFVIREMTNPEGGFYSSLDADSEGEEGKYYLWSLDEIYRSLPSLEESRLIIDAFGITATGNFEGKNILQRVMDDKELASRNNIPLEEILHRLRTVLDKSRESREKRIAPGKDDKCLVAWNSMMLIAFSEAGRYLKREDYAELAIRNGRFISNNTFTAKNNLMRSWRDGRLSQNAALEDYAALVLAFLSLYQTEHYVDWFVKADQLGQEMIAHFKDPEGGFFDTRDDQESLLVRPKDLQDNATPSGNALAATALLQLHAYTGKSEWRDIAEEMLSLIADLAIQHPTAFAHWLCAIDMAQNPINEVAIIGNPDLPRTQDLISGLWNTYRPDIVAAISNFPPPAGSPPLLSNKISRNDLPTAYVCQGFVCQQPVNETNEMLDQLNSRAQ